MRSIPNVLTFIRLALIPIFVVMLLDPTPRDLSIATAIFIIAAATDYVDGIIARRYGAVSDFGKLLDPLADKILVMSALVMLVAQRGDEDGLPWVAGWMVVMILAREMWVTGVRGIAATRGRVIAAGGSGKIKSFLQMVAIVLLLQHDQSIPGLGEGMTCQQLGVDLLFVSIVLAYYGAFEYTVGVLGAPSVSLQDQKEGRQPLPGLHDPETTE